MPAFTALRPSSSEVTLEESVERKLAHYEPGQDHVPLQITLHLRTPMALAHPWLHFDGLLAHLAFREAIGDDYWHLPGKWPMPYRVPLPLAETARVWHGSVSLLDNDEWTSTTIYKRFDSDDLQVMNAGRTNSIDVVRGHFKMMMMRLPYVPAQRIVFFAKGDRRHITRLLKHLNFLGKKAAYGFGEILSSRVTETEEDSSLVDPNGICMRPLPLRMLRSSDDQVRLAWRPPYWDKRNVDACAPPGARVRLK